jgi:integron integrase
MKRTEAIEKLTVVLRRDRYSEKTVESYCGWVSRFFYWLGGEVKAGRSYLTEAGKVDHEARVTGYLSVLGPKVAAATQCQALCALVLFHREVLGSALGELPAWVSAQRPERLPEWVTPEEACAIFDRMRGMARMMAELQFGSGLRLSEVVNLRIKDVRLEEGTIMVRGGKGDKDRVTLLPLSLVAPLRDFFARSRQLWEDDRRDDVPGVYLPDDVARKYASYGKRWEWHWVFPSGKLSKDKVSGIVRRHHAHPDLLNKAVGVACERAQLGRRVTSHAFRHGFATALLASGRPIQEVSQLMGHASIETTQVYLHCLPRLEERLTSPLDVVRNVTVMRRSA